MLFPARAVDSTKSLTCCNIHPDEQPFTPKNLEETISAQLILKDVPTSRPGYLVFAPTLISSEE